jgi:hypothetical protein
MFAIYSQIITPKYICREEKLEKEGRNGGREEERKRGKEKRMRMITKCDKILTFGNSK